MNAQTIDDLAAIDWEERRAMAAIPFEVVGGRPINPVEPHLDEGLGELWFWGEQQAADAIVTAVVGGQRYLLMIRRGDGHGWAVPGGKVDPGETPREAGPRELLEETGLALVETPWVFPARYVPDPRAGRNAWMVTWPCMWELGQVDELPVVAAADDADEAAWLRADDYEQLVGDVTGRGGGVFAAHVGMLRDLLG